MNLRERMEAFIEHLELETKRFELGVGLSNGFVSHIGDSIRKKSIEKIKKKYPQLNENWLLTEQGDMIIENNSLNDHNELYRVGKPRTKDSKLYSIPIFNGDISNDPVYEVDIPQFRDCNFGKIIHDNAMSPSIQDGSIIFCKLVTDKLLIVPGEIYFLKFDNYERVRRIQRTADKNVILAVADNIETDVDGFKKYASFELPVNKIKELYQVKGLMKQNLN